MSGPPDEKRVASGDGSHDGGSDNSKSNEPTNRWDGVGGATRRSVLGSLTSAIATMGLSGHTTALDSKMGTTTGQATRDDLPQSEYLRKYWRREMTVGPTSGHCPPETLSQEWQSTALADGVSSLTPGRNTDSPVYVSGADLTSLSPEGNIYALDRDTGEILSGWPVETNGIPFLTSGGELLYYADLAVAEPGPISVYAVDARTGDSVWDTEVPASSPSIGLQYDPSADVLYTISRGPIVTALDGSSGSEVWQSQLSQGELVPFTRRDGSTLYVPSTSIDPSAGEVDAAYLRAVDLSSGVGDRERWSVSEDGLAVSGVPVVYQDLVVASFGPPNRESDGDTLLVVLNEADGTERWSKSRSDDLVWTGGFFPSNGSGLYAPAGRGVEDGSSEGVLTRLNPNNGDTEWEYDLGGIVGGLQPGDNRMYTANIEGDVAAIDDDSDSAGYGQEVWSETLAGASDDGIEGGGLFLRCGRLYTATTENPGVAYVLDADDGSTLNTFTVDSGIIRSHWVRDGVVWAATGTDTDQEITTTAEENRVYKLANGSDPPDGPEASFTVDPASPEPGQDVTFDASGSSGDIVEYRWDVDGDGADDATTTTPTYVHSYEDGGTYEAALTVEDADGNTDTATETVTVSAPGEGPPALPGQDDPPQDLNGDGLYEDVNGDGEFTIADVQLFFQNRGSDVVQNNAEYFNFADNDPPDVTVGDVQALFQLFQEQG